MFISNFRAQRLQTDRSASCAHIFFDCPEATAMPKVLDTVFVLFSSSSTCPTYSYLPRSTSPMYFTIVCTLSLDRIQPRPISKFGEYGEDHQVTGKKKFSTKETDENEFRSKSEKRNLVTNINFLNTFKPLLFVSGGGVTYVENSEFSVSVYFSINVVDRVLTVTIEVKDNTNATSFLLTTNAVSSSIASGTCNKSLRQLPKPSGWKFLFTPSSRTLFIPSLVFLVTSSLWLTSRILSKKCSLPQCARVSYPLVLNPSLHCQNFLKTQEGRDGIWSWNWKWIFIYVNLQVYSCVLVISIVINIVACPAIYHQACLNDFI